MWGGGAIFVSIYPLICSSQKREDGHFSNLRLFLIQLVWRFSHVRMFLKGSHSLMMFHPFISSLVTVAPTSAALLVSFFLSQLQLLACSLVVPEAQLHCGFRHLGETKILV